MDTAPTGRDGVSWFVRRAGLARFVTFACAGGLALSAATGAHPKVALAGLTLALVGALVGVVRSRAGSLHQTGSLRRARTWSRLLLVSVLLVGLFGGYLIGNLRVAALTGGVLQSHIGEAIEAELCITGQVRANAGWQSATAVVRSVRGVAAAGETVLLEVEPAEDVPSGPGGGQAAAGEAAARAAAALAQGMIVVVKGSIEAPEGPSDSGYDQAKQLLHQGIEVVLRVDGPGAVAVIGRRGGVSGWFDGLRESAKAHLSRGPSPAVNEVLQGVVMGDTAGIDKGWMTAFRRSGTAHMLSVSGLHVASLAAIMIGLARLLRAARWVGFVMAAASALLMIPFVGASPPIVRAAVMICVVLMGRWVGRGRDQWQVLAFAAMLVLALNPFAVFDVGFQLSFAAFVGMLVLLGPLQRWLRRLPAGIASNVAVSVAASAGTAPVALLVFDQTSLVSPLANLLVVPALPLVTALGMASVFLGFAWSGLSTGLDTLASLPMMWTVQVSRLMAVAPVLETGDLGRAALALAAGAAALPAAIALTGRPVRTPLGLLLPFFRRTVTWLRSHRPRSQRRAAALAVTVMMLAMAAGAAAYSPVAGAVQTLQAVAHGRGWPDQVEVRVLDIGQGNAVLVRTPQHHTLLFDGGPDGCDLAGQLRGLGVRTIDVVVISHPHA
ncbi:MAG: ComEC/Rec2 family competence protein, partial [Thermoleophilia bacterium]|nr:ComEC/Rec2 family competence protein [Thermoleophilia bacterium]